MTTPEAERLETAVNALANTEAKAITYLGLYDAEPETVTGVDKAIGSSLHIDASGLGAGYLPTFAEFGFSETFYDQSRFNRRIVKYYKTRESGLALAAIGTVLEWSSDHENPLCLYLGQTSSVSSNSRASINGITILEGLLEDKSLGNIKEHKYANDVFTSRLNRYRDDGVVERDSEFRFSILDPQYKGRRFSFEELKAESQVTYLAFQTAKELSPDRQWSIDEIVDIAKSIIIETDENIDELVIDELVAKIKKQVAVAVSASHPSGYKGVTDKPRQVYPIWEISSAHTEAVAKLVELVKRLCSADPRHLDNARDFALDTYKDPQLARDLLFKDKAHFITKINNPVT